MAEPHKRRLRTDVQQFLKSSNQFLRDYGEFMSEWAMFEMILEVKIAQLANLEPRDASIIIGGLSFGSKPPILYSLLSARRRTAAIPKVKHTHKWQDYTDQLGNVPKPPVAVQ